MQIVSSYILTADTGGTKTKLTLFSKDGVMLSSETCAGMGFISDIADGFPFLNEALRSLLDGRDYSSVKSVVINVGGKNVEQIRSIFKGFFREATVECFREASGIIMSSLCEVENADAILMAGTGSIALAKGKNGNVITDGWSPNVGDFGSGYWIGTEAISRSVKMLESDEPLTQLCKHVTGLEHPFSAFADTTEQMNIRDSVRSRFYPLERQHVAKYCRIAAECARNGDMMAIEIFKDAGHNLAMTVIRGLKIAGLESAKIFVSGGLVNCIDLWGESFAHTLAEADGTYSYRTGEADMTKGALYYAMQNM